MAARLKPPSLGSLAWRWGLIALIGNALALPCLPPQPLNPWLALPAGLAALGAVLLVISLLATAPRPHAKAALLLAALYGLAASAAGLFQGAFGPLGWPAALSALAAALRLPLLVGSLARLARRPDWEALAGLPWRLRTTLWLLTWLSRELPRSLLHECRLRWRRGANAPGWEARIRLWSSLLPAWLDALRQAADRAERRLPHPARAGS